MPILNPAAPRGRYWVCPFKQCRMTKTLRFDFLWDNPRPQLELILQSSLLHVIMAATWFSCSTLREQLKAYQHRPLNKLASALCRHSRYISHSTRPYGNHRLWPNPKHCSRPSPFFAGPSLNSRRHWQCLGALVPPWQTLRKKALPAQGFSRVQLAYAVLPMIWWNFVDGQQISAISTYVEWFSTGIYPCVHTQGLQSETNHTQTIKEKVSMGQHSGLSRCI